MFWIERRGGEYRLGDQCSHYNGKQEFEKLTFDISNNKVLANIGVQGELKYLTIYRDSYRANCGKSNNSWPGVWTAKDSSTYGPYSFSIEIDGHTYDLAKVNWDFRTGLLDNIFPITEMPEPNGRFIVRTLTFTPVSADGSQRLRGVVYGLEIENTSKDEIVGKIILPKLNYNLRKFQNTTQDSWAPPSWALFDPYDFEISSGDADIFNPELEFKLGKGEKFWAPSIIYMPGESTPGEVNKKGTFAWFTESNKYYRGILGHLEIPANPFLAEFYEREVMQAFNSIAMSGAGKMAGSNWGSYPPTRQIWQKDCFYSCLPFMLLDADFARNIILWFDEFGVRHEGTTCTGGVSHSVGLSVAAPLLAGIYYDATADKKFFRQHPGFKEKWNRLLDEILASRIDQDVWLFPTRFISDGPVDGDYHTGSQICVWRAVNGQAKLLEEVWDDKSKADEFATCADMIKASILEKCVFDNSFLVESTWRDGRKPELFSDGEESDTTLMPFYGFMKYDDPLYAKTMEFSFSKENLNYNSSLHALKWIEVPATSPGYNKGLCAGKDSLSLFGEDGYYSELRRVTDADGSVWWWPYGGPGNPEYGNVIRGFMNIGKSGWFAGVYTALFIDRFLGIRYDAPAKNLFFNPHPAISDFAWKDFPMGNDQFSLVYQNGGVVLTNCGREAVTFIAGKSKAIEVPAGQTVELARI